MLQLAFNRGRRWKDAPLRRLNTGPPSRGTGLGLPLTTALVEANNGASMTLKSKEQEGTLVEVVFPPARVLAE
jgi:signal transduction histidine kinase